MCVVCLCARAHRYLCTSVCLSPVSAGAHTRYNAVSVMCGSAHTWRVRTRARTHGGRVYTSPGSAAAHTHCNAPSTHIHNALFPGSAHTLQCALTRLRGRAHTLQCTLYAHTYHCTLYTHMSTRTRRYARIPSPHICAPALHTTHHTTRSHTLSVYMRLQNRPPYSWAQSGPTPLYPPPFGTGPCNAPRAATHNGCVCQSVSCPLRRRCRDERGRVYAGMGVDLRLC